MPLGGDLVNLMIYSKKTHNTSQVAAHYNKMDEVYRTLWGEQLHHGYWKTGKETVQEATENLLRLIIDEANISLDSQVCDVGCGYGASSRYFNNRFKVTGITLSERQYHFSHANGTPVHLGDFLANPFPDSTFDAAIAIESSEHMPKEPFFKEMYRILKPGGTVVILTWLSCEKPSSWEINRLLEPICSEGRLASLGSETEYKRLMEQASFGSIKFREISQQVARTWSVCIKRAVSSFLFDKDFRHFVLNSTEGAFLKTLFRLRLAYFLGSLRYGIFVATKK